MYIFHRSSLSSVSFFFFTAPATTEIYTLSLHDALPISLAARVLQYLGRRRDPDRAVHRRYRQARRRFYRADLRSRRLPGDRKSTRLNSSHLGISYAVFCLKKKTKTK